MTSGLSAVQARVAEIQRLIGTLGGKVTTLGAPGTTAATSPAGRGTGAGAVGGATGTSFADVLDSVDPVAAGSELVAVTPPAEREDGGSTSVGSQVVALARKYLGVPYRWGGTDPDTGLDCSGLTQLVFRQVGVNLPRTSRQQAHEGRAVASVAQARPGDLVFFDSPVDHVGIYVGDGKILHAPRSGSTVRVSTIWETPSAIRRVLPETSPLESGLATRPTVAPTTGGATGGASLSGPFADLFTSVARRHGVDPALLSAVAKTESNYDTRAVSGAGARGLMQLMPGTARDLGVDAFNPAQAVDGAARLLSRYLRDYDGRVDLALAAYNAGPGNVRKYGGVPPFEETRTYVQRVQRTWEDLR